MRRNGVKDMGPQNAIMGEESPTELPKTQVDDSQLKELMKTAKFARSGEFKQLKQHFEQRKDFYTKYLPDGRAVAAQTADENLASMWVAANVIIGEFNAILNVYESAEQYVKDAKQNATT